MIDYYNLFSDFLNDKSFLFSSPFIKNMGFFDLKIKNYGIVFKLLPTKEQIIFFEENILSSAFIYNKTLEYNIFSYKHLGYRLTPLVTDLKEDYPWLKLKNLDSLALANAQQNLLKAWNKFFNKEAKFPKFKKKKDKNSYTTNNQRSKNGTYSIRVEKNYINLPKIGLVKFIKHREIEGHIKNATIKKDNLGTYTISLCCEKLEFIPKINTITKDLFLGLDFSCKEFYVDSNGNFANYENYYYKNEKRLAKLQKRLSKKTKGSKNYIKLKNQIAKLHKKIANERFDFLHKLANKLIQEYKFICVEDLNLKAMSRTLHLGKSIMSKGFGEFRNILNYKLDKVGGLLITINKWYASSKTCNHCGYIKKDLQLKDRIWECPICKNINNRDENAAKNIKEEGYRMFFAGEII